LKAIIEKSRVYGRISAPQSKSYAIRLIFSSLFTEVSLSNLLLSEDVVDAINAVSIFGVKISEGRFEKPEKIALHSDKVYVKASATVLRMLIPIIAVVGGRIFIDGGESLRRRPVKAVVEALKDKGIRFSSDSLPMVIDGKLNDNYIEISGAESSQYVSGFMIAFAIVGGGTIKIKPPIASQSYIEMTADVLKTLGVDVKFCGNRVDIDVNERPRAYSGSIPGDFLLSSFYVASALLTDGFIEVYNLRGFGNRDKPHKIVDIYRYMGAYSVYSNGVWIAKASDIYRGVSVNVFDDPDMAMSIAPLASVAKSTTILSNVANLRLKESDRIEAIISTLKSFGIEAYVHNNSLYIVGGEPFSAVSRCPNDHRVAMMFASIAVKSGGILDNAECVNKSNPLFWSDMKFLGAKISLVIEV